MVFAGCNQYLITLHEESASLSVSKATYASSGAEEAIIYKEFHANHSGCWLSESNDQWIQV